MDNMIVVMVFILTMGSLALLSMFDTNRRETPLEWAVVECEQGNTDACQLKYNILNTGE